MACRRQAGVEHCKNAPNVSQKMQAWPEMLYYQRGLSIRKEAACVRLFIPSRDRQERFCKWANSRFRYPGRARFASASRSRASIRLIGRYGAVASGAPWLFPLSSPIAMGQATSTPLGKAYPKAALANAFGSGMGSGNVPLEQRQKISQYPANKR